MFVVTRNNPSNTLLHTLLLSPAWVCIARKQASKQAHTYFYHRLALPDSVLLRHCTVSGGAERCPP